MADKEAADRLKRALRVAMAAGSIDGWDDLAIRSGVSKTTLENWIYARTVPRSKELRQVGESLRPHSNPALLEAAYAGLEMEEEPEITRLTRALGELVPELQELVILLRAGAEGSMLEVFRRSLEEERRRRGGTPPAPPDEVAGNGKDAETA